VAAGALALAAAAVLAATGAAADPEPPLQREALPGDAQVTYTMIDPLQVPVDAAAAGEGVAQCFGSGRIGGGCQSSIGALVRGNGAALGFTANYSDGVHILGLAVSNHQQLAPADPHTTSFCVGDPAAPGQRPPVSITKTASAAQCRTAVSGERIVAGGAPAIEGLADDGVRGHFWWSVEHLRRVERTLVGIRADGTVLVAVATSARDGVRDGMTVPEAGTWLVAHGVEDAIALDGGHQADVYSAAHGSQTPLERGEPTLQMALLLGDVTAAPAAAAAQAPAPVAAAPAEPPALPARGAAVAAPLHVDGVALGGAGGRGALQVSLGAPVAPESGLVGSHAQMSLGPDDPVELDSRWLAAARAGHHLPDIDPAPAPPAMPDTGVAFPLR